MKLLAHITDENGIRKEQSLKAHCFQTANYASESLRGTEFQHVAFLAGLIHDMGKAKQEFRDYIEAAYRGEEIARGSINHTFAGVIFLLSKYHAENATPWERLTSEIIGYAIGSHHGMFDCVDLDGHNGFIHRLKKNKIELCYEEAVSNFLSDVIDEEKLDEFFHECVGEVQVFFSEAKKTYEKDPQKSFFQISMLTRLVLSSVIYGDRRDTREFMCYKTAPKPPGASWKEMRQYFEDKMLQFHTDSEINYVRKYISEQCLQFAEKPAGIYRLNVPTGAGKTLCSFRYALAHAEKYNKNRIIFIIPLLSVLDQNIKVIRDYVQNPDEVLEHHSNVIQEADRPEELDYYEFLTESWNAPIVVSTLVQLLQILFSHQTSAIGRMQALCDSVIVIDEVQSLPKKMTFMFNMTMNFLQQFCNATIVLSSATQPCFDELKWPLNLVKDPDMVRLTPSQLRIFERAQIINKVDAYGMDLEECSVFCNGLMKQHSSLLVVCNTKSEARSLYLKLRGKAKEEDWEIYHLSAAMCQKHRLDIMEKLENSLSVIQEEFRKKNVKHKVLCISTQLIEAGADLSFESVVRILAGIDNLAQSAGRCNRSNEYGQASGKVYLVNLKNEKLSMLHEIANAQKSTRKVLEYVKDSENESYIGEENTRRFYRYLYRETEREIRYPIKDSMKRYGANYYLADLLANHNDAGIESETYVLHQPFKTIGEEFEVFDQNTIDVIVPYGNGTELIDELKTIGKEYIATDTYNGTMKRVKPYTVSIYEWQKEKLWEMGLVYPILDGRILILDKMAYDNVMGVTDIEEQTVENYIL